MNDPLDFSRSRFWVLVGVIIPLSAGLFTWATGYLTVLSQSGGFPMPWRELFFQSCGIPTCIGPWLRACHICGATSVGYSWPSFALDIIFNTAVGYSVILALPLASRALKSLYRRQKVPDGSFMQPIERQLKPQ